MTISVRRRRVLRPCVGGLIVAALAVAGCSDSKQIEGAGSTTSEAADTTVAESTSTLATSTTVGDTTLPSTSSIPAVDSYLLRTDGVGAFDLGAEVNAVYDGVVELLGPPATDETTEYTVGAGIGQYETAEGDTGFVAPVGRSVCWELRFCLEFGGATADSMTFVGWSYRDDTDATFRSTSGVTIGSRWSEFPDITAQEGGCYSVGYGSVDDIEIILLSTGEMFSSFDDTGNYVVGNPNPADVTVDSMAAGSSPVFLYGDC